MTPFTEKVIQLIQAIPQGKVATYGQIARLAGNARAARQVVRILHSMSEKYQLPWYRVLNAKGEIVIKSEDLFQEQILNLQIEGVKVNQNTKVNLNEYQWQK
ncbi:MGMT family protein [Salirhabdus sp. Marseille-P4669]|uniref:MGMT family protein n=1 Tax=Salirhabdus sp. Marseille-P4669 TaxID=2042310 RepID=UPI000C7DF9D7|nr:MGMT family protein [Salirhabdus sp. Marseille-P4669]